MKPATIALLFAGSALALAALAVAGWASLTWTYVVDLNSQGNVVTRVERNLWNQPLRARKATITEWEGEGRRRVEKAWIMERGDYPNFVRQGHWIRTVHESDGSETGSDLWYIDGREVTREEWERR